MYLLLQFVVMLFAYFTISVFLFSIILWLFCNRQGRCPKWHGHAKYLLSPGEPITFKVRTLPDLTANCTEPLPPYQHKES